MKRFLSLLFSPGVMAIILVVFIVSIALATFIENDFGSASARSIIYNARWFEILLLLGTINLAGRIFSLKLYRKEKRAIFIFHFSFILILAGAAITRYTGIEGTISVREGNTTGRFLSENAYIQIVTQNETHAFKTAFSILSRNQFHKIVRNQRDPIHIRVKAFLPNALETIEPDSKGVPMADIIFSDSSGRQNFIIVPGELKKLGNLFFSFQAPVSDSLNTVSLIVSNDSLYFRAPFAVTISGMGSQSFSILPAKVTHSFDKQFLYTFNGQMIAINNFLNQGKIVARVLPVEQGTTFDALVLELKSGKDRNELVLIGKKGYPGKIKHATINNNEIEITYGSIYYELPFKLKLNDFLLTRYPGSQSPSSYESRVTVIDETLQKTWEQRIYMNNILKHRGYRVYQSSYDADEKGTILSVNHDVAGTSVTYTGYFLMVLGMVLSIFNKNGRLRSLETQTSDFKRKKELLSILIMIGIFGCSSLYAQVDAPEKIRPVDASHAATFGRLIIQDNNGRMEPVNTLSSEVLRKLYRKSSYKGQTPDQIFIGMLADPAKWQFEPIIRTTHPEIQKLLGSKGKYYPFSAFFKGTDYILEDFVAGAFRKKPAMRSKFDNEIIRLDERINIAYLVFAGEFLRLFPVKSDTTHTWYNHQGIKGKLHSEDSVFAENILYAYVQSVRSSMNSGNWSIPNDVVNSISEFQRNNAGGIIPSERKTSIEILLNKTDLFFVIARYYGIIGFVLLILQFIGIFYNKLNLKVPVIVFTSLIVILFSIHSFGLGLRWYVSGHAPWSNGYEALIYIAWASICAGLLLARRNAITLSVTCVLAFMILHVAHLSFMDPQITNLVPVLKSYWLVLHVAIISASYAFLVMGALIAFLNLLLMVVRKKTNHDYVTITIIELTNIIEMALIIGLILLITGVFLGAIWANESWGRYWGWDPKETWALITVLVYAFVTHMRMIPGLKGIYSFNLASLVAASSVIMTYFGVNYYLSGLHSYASGDPLPIPAFVYYVATIIVITAIFAWYRNKKTMV